MSHQPFVIVVILARCALALSSPTLREVRYVVKSTYDELYEDGKAAYAKENWLEAINFFESAIADYKVEKAGMSTCYVECHGKLSGRAVSASSNETELIRSLAAHAQCAEACKRRTLGLRGPISDTVRQRFDAAYPYFYLQYAYFQVGNASDAAAAALTYLLFNPTDEDMFKNMKIYRSLPELEGKAILPVMEPSALVLFSRATTSYRNESYETSIITMRLALDEFFRDFFVCRSNCDSLAGEGAGDENDSVAGGRSFLALLTELYRRQLTCRLYCWINVGAGHGTYHPLDVIPEGFNYIQFSHNKVNNTEAAVQAAVDYLRLKPHNEIMKSNLVYYQSIGMKTDEFTASEQVAQVADQVAADRSLLRKLMQSVPKTEEQAFRDELDIDDPAASGVEKIFEEHALLQVESKKTESSQESSQESSRGETGGNSPVKTPVRSKEDVRAKAKISPVASDDEVLASEQVASEQVEVKIVETPEDHGGLSRFLADGLATEEQCRTMLELAKSATPGSGYNGRPSPHTDKEFFEGLTVAEAAEGAKSGKIDVSSVLMYLDLADSARKFMKGFFKLEDLFFSYSHLVCRTSLIEATSDIKEELKLSHPVHADNCILKEDGRCVKESPAYTWRDYSAILYLNDDFVGGDFFFAHRHNQTVQHRVRPSCGRLVGFGADESNLHGVLPLLSGRRCVVALWMTLEEDKDESNHAVTIQQLAKLREEQVAMAAAASREEL